MKKLIIITLFFAPHCLFANKSTDSQLLDLVNEQLKRGGEEIKQCEVDDVDIFDYDLDGDSESDLLVVANLSPDVCGQDSGTWSYPALFLIEKKKKQLKPIGTYVLNYSTTKLFNPVVEKVSTSPSLVIELMATKGEPIKRNFTFDKKGNTFALRFFDKK